MIYVYCSENMSKVKIDHEEEFEKLTDEEKNSMKGLGVFMARFYDGAKFRIDLDHLTIYVETEEQIYQALKENDAGFMDTCISDDKGKSLFYPGMFTVKYFCSKCNHFHKLGIRCSNIGFFHLKYRKYEVIV